MLKQVQLKAQCGRGRKRTECVEQFHVELTDEFDRLGKAGVMFNMNTLRLLVLHILDHEPHGVYGKGLSDTRSGQKKYEMISYRCVQNVCE